MMKYRVTNISKSITGRSNRKNTFADFSYRVGQMWKRVRIAPDKFLEFSAHQLDNTSKVLEKEGAIKIEIITDSPISSFVGNVVTKVVDKVEKSVDIIEKTLFTNEISVEETVVEEVIAEESVETTSAIETVEEVKGIIGEVKLKKGRKKMDSTEQAD